MIAPMNQEDPKNTEKRVLKDRRKQPTPGLSRYTFFGQRKELRRKSDKGKTDYVDRYSSMIFLLLILIVGLNILDSVFTMMILDLKGLEANPVVRSVIEIHGDKFWIWKLAIVSTCLILLCLHSRFRMVKGILIAICSIYLIVVFYQILLLISL
jgi:hypothetical protein